MPFLSQPTPQQKSEALAGFLFSGIHCIDVCTWGSRGRGGLLHQTASSWFAQPLAALCFLVPTCKRWRRKFVLSIVLQELTASSGIF